MHDLQPILQAHPFLKDLEPRFLEIIVGCAANIVFKPDEIIFRDGEPADKFYIVRQGEVALQVFAPGKGNVILETLGDGDVIGWSWLIPPYTWHLDAQARTQVRAIVFDAKCLREKCEKDHDLGYEMFKRFSTLVVNTLMATRLQLLDLYGEVPA